jgi:mannan endo-1,4-beta-mannosidase
MIDSVLDDAKAMGLNTIRVWGFMEGVTHEHTMQPEPGVFAPPAGVNSALDKLDYTIAQAKARGIRVVIALTNNWGDFGGMQQYVDWFKGTHHDDFYTDPKIKATYKSYVKHLIEHKNRYTGIINNNEPAIMTWELANEPRAQSDPSGELLYSWAKEMSDYVRILAPKQLIALGTEGFFKHEGSNDWTYNGNEGIDWDRNITLPNINYGTFHLYPEHWGQENSEEWGTKWIIDHAKAAQKANKPVVLEEYGIGRNEPRNRDLIYHKWTQTAYEQGLAGSMFWILTSLDPDQPDKMYPDYDGFRILNDGGTTAEILTNHSKQMRGLPYEQKDTVYLAYPVEKMKISDEKFIVLSYPMSTLGNTVKKVQLRLPESDTILDMNDSDGDGYYEVELTAKQIGYGDKTLITIANFTKGELVTDRINVKIDRPIKGYEVGTHYDFNDGNLQGWQKEGTWQANWKNPALQISTELGNPMLQLNIEWSGKNDWEELKLRNFGVPNFGQHTKMRYTMYVPINVGDKGGVRPYAALGDGWVKLDADKHRISVNQLEKVQLNGKTFYKQVVDINLGDVSKKLPDIFLCIVGDKYPLDGSVFIDDIEFLKPIY